MSKIRLMGSAAILAVACALGGAAMAQSGAPMPDWLQQLDLQDVKTDARDHGGHEVEGRLPDGGKFEAKFDRDGKLVKIEADDVALPRTAADQILPQAVRNHEAMTLFAGMQEIKIDRGLIKVEGVQQNGDDLELGFDASGRLVAIDADDTALPQSLIDALLPQSARSSDVISQFARIHEVQTRREGLFRIEGQDAAGKDLRVMIDQDGRLQRFGRHDGHTKRDGRHSQADGGGDRAQMHNGRDGNRPSLRRGDRQKDMVLEFDPVALNQRLTDAGYSAFGLLRQDGPHLLLEARNPAQDPVTLELDRKGEVLRETAR